MQRRSLLIVAAAILLAISAAFLYERLMSKPEPVLLPPVLEQSAPATDMPPAQSGSWAPLTRPQEAPEDKNAASDGKTGNFTEIAKSSYHSVTTENAAEPASLGQGGEVSLPPGIVFSIEDPDKSETAPEEAAPTAAPSADLDAPEETNPDLIARAQMLLNKLGYDAGMPDGQIDARMRQAILNFEQNNGLQATGKVTIQLVTVLERLTS